MNTDKAIKSIMTAVVVTASPDETIKTVKERLLKNGFHHIPVVMEGKVLGMISQSDIQQMEHHFTLFHNPLAEMENKQIFTTILAKEIMSTPILTIMEDEPISKAVDLFLVNILHALPVVDQQDHLTGIVTAYDLLRFAYLPDDKK